MCGKMWSVSLSRMCVFYKIFILQQNIHLRSEIYSERIDFFEPKPMLLGKVIKWGANKWTSCWYVDLIWMILIQTSWFHWDNFPIHYKLSGKRVKKRLRHIKLPMNLDHHSFSHPNMFYVGNFSWFLSVEYQILWIK